MAGKRKRPTTDRQLWIEEARKRARTEHNLRGKAVDAWADRQWRAMTPERRPEEAQRARRDADAAEAAEAAAAAAAPDDDDSDTPLIGSRPTATTGLGEPHRWVRPTQSGVSRRNIGNNEARRTMQTRRQRSIFGPQENTEEEERQPADRTSDSNVYAQGDQSPPVRLRVGPVKIHEGAFTDAEEMILRRQAKLRGLNWPLCSTDNPPEWALAKYLGGGSFGHAHLYVGLDDSDHIVQRMVVKDAWVPNMMWAHTSIWYGDPASSGRRIMEVKIMELLLRNHGSDRVPQILHSDLWPEQQWYRIFMNFHGRGTLEQVIDRYWDKHRVTKQVTRIPEPALWAILHSLTQACLLMAYGGLSEDNHPRPGWSTIVHRDIKPSNIFLDEPDLRDFPTYPRAVVGDFGQALVISNVDPMNPQAYNCGEGTECYQAPETLPFFNAETMLPEHQGPLGSHTNVWGVGCTMARLMNLQHVRTVKGPRYTNGPEEYTWVTDSARRFYSPQLCELVERCVRYDYRARISVRNLARDVDSFTLPGQGEIDIVSSFRRISPDRHADFPEEMRLDVPDDEFKVGMVFDRENAERVD